MSKRILLAILLVLPAAVHADVRINEIAWMGASDNANAEWIELYNTGNDSVSLAGWKLTSSSGSPTITLAGSIAGNGYYLLTRTSTSIIAGVTGDQAYTGGLSNSGTTLTLSDATGTVVDSVVGGTDWGNIGGDNTSKETPQRTDADTWITATPTPRAATAASSDATSTDEDASSTPSASIGGSTESHSSSSLPTLYLHIGSNRIVATHADTPYAAFLYEDDASLIGVPISWSFGDGTQATGASVHHAFTTPGTYLVVARAEVPGRASVIKTLEVVVQDSKISMELTPEGIVLTNQTPDILDLSEWQFETQSKKFILPRDTAILPGMPVLFSTVVTGLPVASTTTLRYPDGMIAVAADVPHITPEPVATTTPSVSVTIPRSRKEVVPAPVAPEPAPTLPAAVYEGNTNWFVSLLNLFRKSVSR